MDKVRVVVAEPGKRAEVRMVAPDLETLMSVVGGELDLLEWCKLEQRIAWMGLHVYVRVDALEAGLELNRASYVFHTSQSDDFVLKLYGGEPLAGPILVSLADEEGVEIGLTEAQALEVSAVLDDWQRLTTIRDGRAAARHMAETLTKIEAARKKTIRNVPPYTNGAMFDCGGQ